jgi:hypothetical protein
MVTVPKGSNPAGVTTDEARGIVGAASTKSHLLSSSGPASVDAMRSSLPSGGNKTVPSSTKAAQACGRRSLSASGGAMERPADQNGSWVPGPSGRRSKVQGPICKPCVTLMANC